MRSTVFIGDAHLGDPLQLERKITALKSLIQFSVDRGFQLVSLGDLLELGETSNMTAVRRETRFLLDDLLNYQKKTGLSLEVVRGNHDRYLCSDIMREAFPGIVSTIHPVFYTDPQGSIVGHHGDLADVRHKPLQTYLGEYSGKGLTDIEAFLQQEGAFMDDRQDYHTRNMTAIWTLMFALEKAYVSVEEQQKWHNLYYSHSLFINSAAALVRGTVKEEDNYELAMNTWLLQHAPNAQIIAQGHTHVPMQMKWEAGSGSEGLIVNTGSVFSGAQLPTAALWSPDRSTLTLLQYRNSGWRIVKETKLKDQANVFMPAADGNGIGRQFTKPRATEIARQLSRLILQKA